MISSIRHEGLRFFNIARTGGRISSNKLTQSASFASSSRIQSASEENQQSSNAQQQASSTSSNLNDIESHSFSSKVENEDQSVKLTSSPSPSKRTKPGPMQFDIASFPSLLHEPHPVLDAYEKWNSPPTKEAPFSSSVTFFNSPRYFASRKPSAAEIIQSGGDAGGSDDIDSSAYLSSVTPLSAREVNGLHRHLLKVRRVTQQTGKGRFSRMSALVVVGNGRGMVGYGDGKDINAGSAARKAFHAAVKNMDFVERFNGHTIPAEISGKWSSTRVTLRPRPQGFGLRVPPVIHAVARSAGITDMSASILGSTNPINVVKATLALLWGGSAPQGLGDGIGGSMRRVDRGVGMRTVRDIELARGRRLREVDLSKE